LAVCLGARAAHSWAFAAIEDPELNAAKVGSPPHKAVQGINFPHQMAFSEPANGGIAGHCSDGAELVGEEGRLSAQAGGRGRRFTAGVAAANNYDVESICHQKPSDTAL
jgi:hypothetical protein